MLMKAWKNFLTWYFCNLSIYYLLIVRVFRSAYFTPHNILCIYQNSTKKGELICFPIHQIFLTNSDNHAFDTSA